MPASNHPVETSSTWSSLVRSTGGPQPTVANRASKRESRTGARMRRILEHPHLHALERLVFRQLAGTERRQVGPLDADHDAARVGVGGRDQRTVVVAPRGDGEPLVGANAQRDA